MFISPETIMEVSLFYLGKKKEAKSSLTINPDRLGMVLASSSVPHYQLVSSAQVEAGRREWVFLM